jgi:hypothetical protein
MEQTNTTELQQLIKEITGKATPEQIELLKAAVIKKYGPTHKVYQYVVDGLTCYLRSVDRDLYAMAAAKISVSPAKFSETVIEGIWLGGDKAIKDVDQYRFALIDHVEELMNKKKGDLGEL